MNDIERGRRALEIFDEIADLDAPQRMRRLSELCAGDDDLRTRVQALLDADAGTVEPFSGNAAAWSDALARDDVSDRMAGRSIGAWKITGTIGRGGMGTVYAVERSDGAYAQQAALKLIRASADSPAVRDRFLRERQILARLQHPNIATLLDGGISAEGEPWFVMERVDGVAIDQWCDQHGLGLRDRITLFLQVLDAVRYAHRNLVVHRDLKPSNLLVDDEGRVKLLDFGIAKQLEGSDVTVAQDRALTFEYASPEQLHDAPITTASDIWQLGVILHRLLAGSHPFGLTQQTPVAKQLQQMEREPETLTRAAAHASVEQAAQRGGLSPASLARALRGGLPDIAKGCLRHDPEARYASADALANDLRAWLDDRPITATRLPRGERVRLWLRRNRMLATSAAAIALALLAGTGVALWQARSAREQARIAQRENANTIATMQYLNDAFAAASPEHALKSNLSARQLLDHAREELDKRGSVDPKVRQPVQRMLGRFYYSLNEPKQAVDMLAAGTRNVVPRSREEALALADDLVVYSKALDSLERFPETLAAADRAVALRKQFAPDDPEQQLRSLANISLAHVYKYGLDACRKQAEQALAFSKQMQDPPVDVVLHVYTLISDGARLADDRGRLLLSSDEGLAFADHHGIPPESPLRSSLIRNQGQGLISLGRYAEAESVLHAGIAAIEKTGSAGDSRLGILYSALSDALNMQGRYREALAANDRSGQLMPQADNGPRNLATVLGNRATLLDSYGDYPNSLAVMRQSMAKLDEGGVAPGDPFRAPMAMQYARALRINGYATEANTILVRQQAEVRKAEGEDSENYALILREMANSAFRAGDTTHGPALVDEARRRYAKRGMPATHKQFAQFLRYDAAFVRIRGDLATAEDKQREALGRLQSVGNPFDVAVARAELAAIRADRGDMAEARTLLAQALPVLRQSVLPQEIDRAAAEKLAKRLGA
ncbi:MAG: protein kinase [Proteobacteria bacterium]|nr:protein kinase [Pseudomonadota bacterium]MBS0217930.1 protein kinase [Pseudomonadota bacterium]